MLCRGTLASGRGAARGAARALSTAAVDPLSRDWDSVGSDEQVATAGMVHARRIDELVAEQWGSEVAEGIELYGRYKAKLPLGLLDTMAEKKKGSAPGKLILVTAMTPTKFGEGKTCVSVGLADGLAHIGKVAHAALREPSLGPVFGMKGGAAGGGYAQLLPMSDINLHFTGDMHAIGAAHNLLAAMLDNRLHWQNRGPAKHGANDPQIDGRSVEWGRVLDMNERALRSVIVALDPAGAGGNGVTRQSRFDITVASEVMAILCLATDMGDLQRRLGNIVVGRSKATAAGDSQIVTAKDIGADGAMAALLRDALQPNIVQSLEGNLGFVHGGPFANIAHGCSTVLATKAAMAMGEYVVTEGGFGADLGAEKFLNIKCRKSGIAPSAAVVVATTRALKLHGGGDDAAAVAAGMPNLLRHCENLSKFGLPVVVAVNKFKTDTADELDAIKSGCAAAGMDAIESTHWAHGGAGAADLAQAVVDVVEAGPTTPKLDFLYPDSMPLKEKLETLAREIYRADGVAFSSQAATKLKRYESQGFGNLPVCVAKTQYSFSDNPKLLNAPTGHTLHVADVRLCAGSEFVVALTGDIMTMPGLPRRPAAESIAVNGEGQITGLF